jgi:hypothetical protein
MRAKNGREFFVQRNRVDADTCLRMIHSVLEEDGLDSLGEDCNGDRLIHARGTLS